MSDTHQPEEPDAVARRRIGTRSFVYGAKTLATAVVALILSVATDRVTEPAFWVLVSAGALGVMFSLIERSTTDGAEVVNQRRVNVDVVVTVLVAVFVNLVMHVAQR